MGCVGKRTRFCRKRQNGLELKINFIWGTRKKKDPNIISGAALSVEKTEELCEKDVERTR